MSTPLIEAKGLSKTYSRSFSPIGLALRAVDRAFSAFGYDGSPSLRAVEDLSFTVKAEGIVGFLGPNGAGKTTTLKMVMGFLRPTKGAVFLFGKELFDDYRAIYDRVGGLIDKPHFYEYLSGRVNLQLKSHLYPRVTPKRIAECLDLVGVADAADRKVQTYSTGMKQRLGLAAAILHKPDLLVLDEPTRGLDPKGQAEIRTILKQIRDEGKTTILLSSHLLQEVELICDNVVIIERGRHLYSGEVKSLLEGKGELVKVVVDKPDKAKAILLEDKDISSVEISGTGNNAILSIKTLSGGAPHVAKLLVEKEISLLELSPVRRSLEEFFLKVTAGEEENGNTES